jgi:hypothetical protein
MGNTADMILCVSHFMKCRHLLAKKKRRGQTNIVAEYTIEIFQWKKTKKMAVVGFQTDENGRELGRW